MEFKTCEEYVLAELARAQKRIEELEDVIKELDAEIYLLKCCNSEGKEF